MSMQDPIADLLTRIRNANRVGRRYVFVPKSKIGVGILNVLKDEGYIDGYDEIEAKPVNQIRVQLRYALSGQSVIHEIQRVSKPGRRVYSSVEKLPKVLDGLGISVISTSRGVMSDRRARESNVGGEVLCQVS
ncbi:MAG: 30S ribosomal protein S8 [Phycisphaerae bacterium]|nr:MAG: 30S ribosomal protein S8 [Phycisphaerae bacterium]